MKLLYLGLTAMLMTTLQAGATTEPGTQTTQPLTFIGTQTKASIWVPSGGLSINFGGYDDRINVRKVATVRVPDAQLKKLEQIDSSGVDPGDTAAILKIRCANAFIAEVEESRAMRAAIYDFNTPVMKVRQRLPEYWQRKFVPAPLYEYVAHPDARTSDQECKG